MNKAQATQTGTERNNMDFVIDIEANMLLQDALDYSELPYKLKEDFKIWCVVVRHVPTGITKYLIQENLSKANLQHLLRKCTNLIGHNIVQYDLPVLQLYGLLDYEIQYPGAGTIATLFGKNVHITDTLLLSKLLNADRFGGHSLAAWGKRLGNYKGDFKYFDKFSQEMLDYCIQDTAVNVDIYLELLKEKGDHDWSVPYSMEIKLYDIGLKRELFGFSFDKELAESNLQELETFMSEIAEKVNPLLPEKKMTKGAVKEYTMPKIKFKKDGTISTVFQKFLDKHNATYNREDNSVKYQGQFFLVNDDLPLKTTETATIEDIDTVKSYLISLGWIPSEVKERDLTKNTDKSIKKVTEVVEAINRYIKQTEESLFKQLRLDFFEVNTIEELAKLLKSKLEETKPQVKWGKAQPQRPIFVPTTPKLTVGVEKELCPNLVSLGEKADFVKDVVKYYTYRHRKNAIAGGVVDEDGEPETGFISCVREDGRIPTPADTLGANTGRYRHKIVCNIPRVTSLYGEPMRNLFGCGNGFYQLGFDFASLEARIMGHYVIPFKDGIALAEALVAEKPNDIHSINARKLGIDRSSAKSFSYASIYGAQPKKLAKMLGITTKEAERLFNDYWDAVPALKELKTAVEKEWEQGGKKAIKGLDGRLLNTRSKHSLINVLFQSGGAISAKWTTVKLCQFLENRGLLGNPFTDSKTDIKVWMMIEMHDEAQMAVHPSLLKIEGGFQDEEQAKINLHGKAGCSAVGHGLKGYYYGLKTTPVEAIETAIAEVCSTFKMNVDLGFEWIPGKTWGQCH